MDHGHEAVPRAGDASGVAGPEPALQKIVVKSALATMGTPEYHTRFDALAPDKRGPRTVMMGDDPALADAADVVIVPAPDGAYRGRTARRVMLDLPTRLDDLADAEALADRMKSLIDEGACDGFHLLPARLPEDLTAIAAHLIPCLRARGSRRAAYAGSTLRDHLGLPRPSVRFAELAPAP